MRESAVRTAVIDLAEAIVTDRKASHRDKLRVRRARRREVVSSPSRRVEVLVDEPPEMIGIFGVLTMGVGYLVTFDYQAGSDDRLAEDAARFSVRVYTLHQSSPSIHTATATRVGVGDVEGRVRVAWMVRVTYAGDSELNTNTARA